MFDIVKGLVGIVAAVFILILVIPLIGGFIGETIKGVASIRASECTDWNALSSPAGERALAIKLNCLHFAKLPEAEDCPAIDWVALRDLPAVKAVNAKRTRATEPAL